MIRFLLSSTTLDLAEVLGILYALFGLKACKVFLSESYSMVITDELVRIRSNIKVSLKNIFFKKRQLLIFETICRY